MILSQGLERRLVKSAQALLLVAFSYRFWRLLVTMRATEYPEICRRARLTGKTIVVWFCVAFNACSVEVCRVAGPR